jgi:hypothetical protein
MIGTQRSHPVALRVTWAAPMNLRLFRIFLTAFAGTVAAAPVAAQDASLPAVTAPKKGPDGSRCELHVWPIDEYTTDMWGALSAIPLVGFSLDQGSTKNRRQAIQSLMREYLSPEIQIDLLRKQGGANALGLIGYEIIVEEAFPSREALKESKELREKRKKRFALLKAGKRLTDSQSSCYAELGITTVAYRDIPQLKSNMFIGWSYRYYGASPTLQSEIVLNSGGVPDGSLSFFLPTTEVDVERARNEVQYQFTKGFLGFARNVRR